MRLTYPLPLAINGEALAAAITAATGVRLTYQDVTVEGDELAVVLPDGLDEAAVEPLVAAAVAAHTGAPTAAQQAELDADAEAAGARLAIEPILAKCRDVYAGNSTFTVAQRDRLLAGLALLAWRRLR